MAFPGGGFGPMGLPGGQPMMSEQQLQEQRMVKMMSAAMESCMGKTVMAGVMGFALGGAFGLFMSSMRYDTPLSSTLPGSPASLTDLPIRQQLRLGLRDMGRQSFSSAKNFGLIGAIFSGTECCIEGLRAKNDLWNGVLGGCITGGALAAKAGPQAMVVGCAGFAAFSAAIDGYMRMPEEERRKNIV